MSDNYFMSEHFHRQTVEAVRRTIAESEALGLPKAHSDRIQAPAETTEVVRLTTKTKKPNEAIKPA